MNTFKRLVLLPLLLFLFQVNYVIGQCSPDVTPPVIECRDAVTLSPGPFGSTEIYLIDFLESVMDECDGTDVTLGYSLDGSAVTYSDTSIIVNCDDLGSHSVVIWAKDGSGNESSCTVPLEVTDQVAPTAVCNDQIMVALNVDGLYDLHFSDVDEGSSDACFGSITRLISIGNLPPAENILLDCAYLGTHEVVLSVEDEEGNQNFCWSLVTITDPLEVCETTTVSGHVFLDADEDCTMDAGETGIGSWDVELTDVDHGLTHNITADASGYYEFQQAVSPGLTEAHFIVRLPDLPGFLMPCGTDYFFSVPNGTPAMTVDIPVTLYDACPLMQIDIGTDRLRFCDEGILYVNLYNFSTQTIEDVYVEVTLDDALTYTGTNGTLGGSNGNVYTFDIGDLSPGAYGLFQIYVDVTCDEPVFQTVCVQAEIFPNEPCGEPNPLWSGASILAEADCDGDQVSFRLINEGTGDMASALNYRIVEDVVMYMQDTFNLTSGQDQLIQMEANGSTWRIEAEQEPGHPGVYQPIAWVEGCGGFGTTGIVNLFPINNTNPFESKFCIETSASYDPNDKQGFPRGLTDQGFIEAGQGIDYMIRFQNTGNDTAFQVVLVDTLAETLDWGSIRPGVSSHRYDFEATNEGIIKFIFDPIVLPDSNVNEAASHGFVRFHIDQKPGLPLGTVIENSAAIYFDNNPPIFTNATKHTLAEDFVVTSTNNPLLTDLEVKIAPNPFTHMVYFDLGDRIINRGTLQLYDGTGKQIRALSISSSTFSLSGEGLAPGIYLFDLHADGQWLTSGKLMVK